MGICVRTHVYTHRSVCRCIYMYVMCRCLWKPEADVWCLSWLFSILFFEARCLMIWSLSVQLDWLAQAQRILFTSPGLGFYVHTNIASFSHIGSGDLNSGTHACTSSILPTEPSSQPDRWVLHYLWTIHDICSIKFLNFCQSSRNMILVNHILIWSYKFWFVLISRVYFYSFASLCHLSFVKCLFDVV